jgi:hypothetical protein
VFIGTTSRRLAALTAAGVAAGSLSLVAFGTPAHAAGVTIDKTFNYTCDVVISTGGSTLPAPDQLVTVRSQATLPAVYPGQSVPATPITITLGMPESLRAAAAVVGGKTVDGSSSDSTIGFTILGARKNVPIVGLSVKGSPIPQTAGTPWTVPIKGTVPAVPVPSGLAGQSVSLEQPAAFTAKAVIHATSGDDATTLTCTMVPGQSAELLAKPIAITKAPTSIGSAKVSPKAVKAHKKSKLTVKVASPGATPAGKVTVTLKNKKVGSATLKNGSATVKLKAFAKKGKQKLKVTYGGSADSAGSSKTVKITVK